MNKTIELIKWKTINGYEGRYKINQGGDVLSVARRIPKILNKRIHKQDGYFEVELSLNKKRKTYKVHRLIAEYFIDGFDSNNQVDHIDGDPCNNSITNLRMVTISQNQMNKKKYKITSSKYKGVTQKKGSNKYTARIKHNGKDLHLGTFESDDLAARAYDEKAKELFGPYAMTNKDMGLYKAGAIETHRMSQWQELADRGGLEKA